MNRDERGFSKKTGSSVKHFGGVAGGNPDRRRLGAAGEERAAVYLDSLGYEILERNFRCRYGEIDIIAREDRTICFVEVKTRTRSDYGLPCQAVNRQKADRIRKCAYFYLSGCRVEYSDIRIDIIELLFRDGKYLIRHLKNEWR